MAVFPSYFPENFHETMLPGDAAYESRFGYRVAKYGPECPFSYVSTYEDRIIDGKGLKENPGVGDYSTSLFDTRDYPGYILTLTMRDDKKPKACLVSGYTHPFCGPSRIGPVKKCKTSNGPVQCRHIDWWIYEDASPWEYFKKAGDEE